MKHASDIAATLIVSALLSIACIRYTPHPIEEASLQSRSVSVEHDGIRASAFVPDAAEVKRVFGVPLQERGIQPVWLEIHNETTNSFFLNPTELDALYYTPTEAAYASRFKWSRHLPSVGVFKVLFLPLLIPGWIEYPAARVANDRMAERFRELALEDTLLRPGQSIRGFYFSRLSEGTKSVEVHLLGPSGEKKLELFVPVSGVEMDYARLNDELRFYTPDQMHDYSDPAEFLAALEKLPCCTTDALGLTEGDPLNMIVVGEPEDVFFAFLRADWDETETLNLRSAWRSFTAFFSGRRYRNSPMSKLFLFGRGQDIGFQRIRNSIHDRHHFRLWLAPMTWKGTPVWICAITRDMGVKFTTKSWYLTTHEIDPLVDDARTYVALTLLNTHRVAAVAAVKGVGAAGWDAPRHNTLGSQWVTDGFRLVVVLSHAPVEHVRFIDIGIEGAETIRGATE